MVSISVARQSGAGTGALLLACVSESGSASHPFFTGETLRRGPDGARNLADAIHFLCTLHGRAPGILEHAADRTTEAAARRWMDSATSAMMAEREFLTRLVVAAGPVPGTPGAAASEAAAGHQRTALATLAQSERRGCALGAALAFAADWAPIRDLLEPAAARLSVQVEPCFFNDLSAIAAIADEAGDSPAFARALLFGAEQVALQHRALWDILEARAQARTA